MMDTPPNAEVDAPGPERDRYGELSLESGDLVIYDRVDPEAYVQSDTAVSLER